ncbi:MAG: ribonuclease III [Abditibacteriota bacterium]|nr:ribonuclease III [Abditibacteriota bacterium]
MDDKQIGELSERAGVPLVPSAYLDQCFVHKSVRQDGLDAEYNERLEFLGDSIVGEIVARILFDKYPDCREGDLSRMKAVVIGEPSLAEAARRLKLYEYIQVSENEKKTGLVMRPSVLCDTFEALTAAIYLSCGREVCEAFVRGQLSESIESALEAIEDVDTKSALQTLLQDKFHSAPTYETVEETGPPHNKTFTNCVLFSGRTLARGTGASKKAAEKDAAARALGILREEFAAVYDVCVAGAGLAGVCAAVSAARAGASVLLCDRLPGPGGMAVYGLVNPFMTHCTSDGKPLVGGLFDELRQRLADRGALRKNCFDSSAMREALLDMLREAGVTFLPRCGFVSAVRRQNGAFAVALEGRFLECRRLIDATGDAQVAACLGAETRTGDSKGQVQAATLMFDVGGVDVRRALAYVAERPEEFLFPKLEPGTDVIETALSNYSPAGYFSLVGKAKEEGSDFPGDMIFYIYRKTQSPRYDAVVFNQTHAALADPLSPGDIARGTGECQKQLREVLRFVRDRVPGFEKAYLLKRAKILGVRESRRVVGDYVFSDRDVLSSMKHRDRVCRLAYPVDVHSASGEGYTLKESGKKSAAPPPGDWYEIPYRCLTVKSIPGLLCCGRIISATHEGLGAARIMPCVIATGQAAGAAAALSVQQNVSPDKLDYILLKPYLALADNKQE